MPFTAHFGEAADKENERRAISYDQMIAVAARNLVDDASRELQQSVGDVITAADMARNEIRSLVHHVYLLIGICPVACLLVALIVVLVLR